MKQSCLYESPIGILKISEDDGKITNLSLYLQENDPESDMNLQQNQPNGQSGPNQHNRNQSESQKEHSQKQQELQNREHLGLQTNEQHSALLQETCRQLDEYFRGERRQFDLPLGYAGTPFQESVWRELQKIPYGETRNYEDIAVKIGNPKAVRAVGQANNRNPILLIIPCHRVIHKSGDISGFACGIETKKYLLDLERRGGCP